MEKISDWNEATIKLKEHRILVSVNKNEKIYYFLSSLETLTVVGENYRAKITMEDFKHLFFSTVFYLFEQEKSKELVDPYKDAEYYSWRYK